MEEWWEVFLPLGRVMMSLYSQIHQNIIWYLQSYEGTRELDHGRGIQDYYVSEYALEKGLTSRKIRRFKIR